MDLDFWIIIALPENSSLALLDVPRPPWGVKMRVPITNEPSVAANSLQLEDDPRRLRAISHLNWRRKRDSNPRASYPANGFQDRRLQPLGHSSDSYSSGYRTE